MDLVKFYTAEIVTILEYLRGKGVAHRDLKPSNLLLDQNYHIKLIDFGTAKIVERKQTIKQVCLEMTEKDSVVSAVKEVQMMKQKGTMVGTEDYISPEILEEKVSGPSADLWSLGVILYMMLTGDSPFKHQSQFITFRNIRDVKYTFPDDPSFTEEARDLVRKLLVKDPQ